MKVSVFGGSQPKAGSPAYEEAQTLGEALARRGHTVLTGGYAGTMEAVSRGAASAGGHVIGVTCVELERSHRVAVNRWVGEEWKKPTTLGRLQALVESSDAALALAGGPGTLTEIALSWSLMIAGALVRQPMILIGSAWRAVLEEFFLSLGEYTPHSQRDLLQFAATPGAALKMLSDHSA
jgi:uncharacterized protein (TIGR00725 family)